MTEPRYRILRLLDERQHAGKAGIPTMGEIAEALGMSLRDVSLILKSSEAMGMVAIHRYNGATAQATRTHPPATPSSSLFARSKRGITACRPPSSGSSSAPAAAAPR